MASVRESTPHSARSSASSAFMRFHCAVFERSSVAYLRKSSPLRTGLPLIESRSTARADSSASISIRSRPTTLRRWMTCSFFLATRLPCCRNMASLSSGLFICERLRSSSELTARMSICCCCPMCAISASDAVGSDRVCCSSSSLRCLAWISIGSVSSTLCSISITSRSSFCSSCVVSAPPLSLARFSLRVATSPLSRCSACSSCAFCSLSRSCSLTCSSCCSRSWCAACNMSSKFSMLSSLPLSDSTFCASWPLSSSICMMAFLISCGEMSCDLYFSLVLCTSLNSSCRSL
mmetsp:Transcript_60837/g.166740  ORF Transcript_60837/g.166740 Transcript_60837/m.166740 type:complete len:292 (+) Transcript_60837:770-1645(+)